MGLRWKAEYHSYDYDGSEANLYTVHIIDSTTGTDPETEFKIKEKSLVITGTPDSEDQCCTIVSTKCDFTIVVDRLGVQDFITLLATANEGRFWLRVKRGASVIFIGPIVTQGAAIDDLDYPYNAKFSALDELTRIKDRDFDAETAYKALPFEPSIFRYLKYIFAMTDLSDHYGVSEPFIEFYGGWRSDSATSGTDNPYILMGFHYKAFDKVEGDEVKKMKVKDVLHALMTAMHARLIFSNGVYVVEQIPYRAQNTTVDYWRYDVDFTFISKVTGVTVLNPTYDHAGTMHRISGGKKSFLPPLQYAEIEYEHEAVDDFFLYDHTYTFNTLLSEDDVLITDNAMKLRVEFKAYITNGNFSATAPPINAIRPIFRFTVKLGTKYLKREINGGSFAFPTYTDVTWESSLSYYEFAPVLEDRQRGYTAFHAFVTRELVNDFTLNSTYDLEVTLASVQYYDRNLQKNTTTTEYTLSSGELYVFPTEKENTALEKTRTLYRALNSNDNTTVIEKKVLLGDGPTKDSVTGVRVGYNWVRNTEDWGDDDQNLNDLLATSIMSLQAKPTYKLVNWPIIADTFRPTWYMDYDSRTWMLLSYQYNTDEELITGTWMEVDYDDTGVTLEKDEYVTLGEPFTPLGNVQSDPSGPVNGGFQVDLSGYAEDFDDVTANKVVLTGTGWLPDQATVSTAEIIRRVTVVVSGITLNYQQPLGYQIDYANNEIEFLDRSGNGLRNLQSEDVSISVAI